MANLKADPKSTVKGVVIESKVDKGLGYASSFISMVFSYVKK